MTQKESAFALVKVQDNKGVPGEPGSVIAVFDSLDSANEWLAQFAALDPDSRYEVVQTVHIVVPEQVQGIPVRRDATTQLLSELFQRLARSRDDMGTPGFRAMMGHIAELVVAQALDARIVHTHEPFDLLLSDGQRVEVKTVILKPEYQRAPRLDISPKEEFDVLALVLFDPNLQVVSARLIPRTVIEKFSKVSGRHDHPNRHVTVTPILLSYPGTKDIPIT